jgi:predicted enzyme related to lactoylglutathione lyase
MDKRVTGLGGVFFKAEDPKKIKEWYKNHLGVEGIFQWRPADGSGGPEPAQTVFNPFKADTTYFAPSEKPFMFNFRVENLDALLEALRAEGVTVVGTVEEYPYGKFGWILDPEGNKIELWEPRD